MKVPGTQQQETTPETKVEETNETAPPAAPETPADSVSETAPEEVKDTVSEQHVGAFVDRQPCNWFIRPDEEVEGLIEASNSISREHFRGTIAEFNAALRG